MKFNKTVRLTFLFAFLLCLIGAAQEKTVTVKIGTNLVQVIPYNGVDEVSVTISAPIIPPDTNAPPVLPDTNAPSVSITTLPTTYTNAQTVTVKAVASDDVGVTRVNFYKGDTLRSATWPLTSADNGSHIWTARAFDAAGNSNTSASVNLSVDIPIVPAGTNVFEDRLVFYRGNLAIDEDRDRLIGVMRDAARWKWNGIVIEESGCLKQLIPDIACLANLEIVKAEAEVLGLNFNPYTFSQSEANKGSAMDLREAFPAETKFVRSGSSAFPQAEPNVVLANGGFETFTGNTPSGWAVDAPGTISFVDTNKTHSGRASLRFQNPASDAAHSYHARALQYVPARPFASYKISAWVSTDAFSNPALIKFYVVGGSNKRILWSNRDGGLGSTKPAATQGWTRFEIDVNSLENSQLIIYVAATGVATGKVWFDDVAIAETGLYMTVRRPTTPIVVRGYAGTPIYSEGRDFVVGSEQLTIPTSSTIPAGAALKVSWYQLANTAELWTVPGVATLPVFYDVLRTNALAVKSKLGNIDAWAIRANEWRVGAWDQSADGMTMGDYLANFGKQVEGIINSVAPGTRVLAWNDMFDPYHNAGPVLYYMAKGPLYGAWTGFSTNVVILNWYNAGTTANMEFWAGLDPKYPKKPHQQILCVYYENLNNVKLWLTLLDQAEAKGVKGVRGVMYTTWSNDQFGKIGRYGDLEAVARLCGSRWPKL